jgi:protein-tyrosine kinase
VSTIERAMRRLNGEPEPQEVLPAAAALPEGSPTAETAAPASPLAAPTQTMPPPQAPAPPRTGAARGERGGGQLTLDFERLQRLGFITPVQTASRLTEEFQQVKRRLIANTLPGALASSRPANLIMVTSSVPGEGKTYSSLNLAMSLAMEIDRTVLAVDSDILKSDLSRLFGAFNRPGLYDVLTHPDLDIAEVILRTNVPTLSFIPAGTVREGITERLASTAMMQLVAELAARYADRLIIFDAPPVLSMSGAAALAPLMGQVVLVVEAYNTTQELLKRTLAALEHVEITGLLLNKIRHQAAGGSYGYGGYGSYAGYGSNAQPRQ